MKRIEVWLRSVGGALQAGLRNDAGDDGSSLAANPDGSSIGIAGNQLIRGPGALPAPGSSPKPNAADPTAVAIELASPSAMLLVATDQADKNKALALHPDWSTVVIDDGVPSNVLLSPIAPFYPAHITGTFPRNRLTVLMPPALTRGCVVTPWGLSYSSFIHPSDGTIAVPLVSVGPHADIGAPFWYDGREWIEPQITGEWGWTPQTIYVPEDGTYVWTVNANYTVQWGGPPVDFWDDTIPFHDSDGFDLQGLPVTVTLEFSVGGSVVAILSDTFVSPQGYADSSWPGDGGSYQLTPHATPPSTSGESSLSRGQTVSVTVACSSPAPQSRIWYDFKIFMFGVA